MSADIETTKILSFLSSEWVHYPNPVNLAAILEIFGQQNATATLFCRSQDEGVPKRKPVQPMEIDGCENIRNVWRGDIKLCQNFDLAARDMAIDAQLSCDAREILLKHLQGNNAAPGSPVFCHQIAGTTLFGWCRFVVGVEEDIGVEKTTNAHEPRRD
jgi:hypothetical protein